MVKICAYFYPQSLPLHVRFRAECVDGRMLATWLLDKFFNQCEYIGPSDEAQAGHNFNEPWCGGRWNQHDGVAHVHRGLTAPTCFVHVVIVGPQPWSILNFRRSVKWFTPSPPNFNVVCENLFERTSSTWSQHWNWGLGGCALGSIWS